MTTMYYNREGERIPRPLFTELQGKEEYVVVRQFDNDKFRLTVRWIGAVPNADSYLPSYRPIFKIYAWNRVMDYEGNMTDRWAIDPVYDGTFPNEREAVLQYEAILAKWTSSGYEVDSKTGNKVFKEEANLYTPPDPDAPAIVSLGEADIDEVGAW